MKAKAHKLFLKSPSFIQNIALSLYGLNARYIRYGGNYKIHYKNVSSHLKYSQNELDVYIKSSLQKTLKEAVLNVPYYRELFKKEKILLEHIKSIEDLSSIPVLEKDELRRAPENLVNSNYDIDKLLVVHTTGTTGTPLNIYCDYETRRRNYAFYNRFLNSAGIATCGKKATFGGRIIVPPEQTKPPFWRYSYFQKNLLFSSYHLNDENIPSYIEKLKKYKPDIVDSYPSSLYSIVKYAISHNIDLSGVAKGITTSAETLFADQRQLIEAAFNVPVYDQYGAVEMCVFIGQCSKGRYHIHSDYGITEFLHKDGSKAKPGEEAEIVCTGFINPVMPLIRYRIGDRGIYTDRPCECGSLFPVLEKILGRIDDVIITPDGRHVGRLSPVLKGFPVKEVQYIQRVKDVVEVYLVKDEQYYDSTEKELLNALRLR
ncbi:MAG: hypothetical protein OEY89_18875, partial [Gammaproteobacteria bacterium]|nr:hypothetical protein [Gammaproteobacteria bacterium]